MGGRWGRVEVDGVGGRWGRVEVDGVGGRGTSISSNT